MESIARLLGLTVKELSNIRKELSTQTSESRKARRQARRATESTADQLREYDRINGDDFHDGDAFDVDPDDVGPCHMYWGHPQNRCVFQKGHDGKHAYEMHIDEDISD